MPNLIMMMMNLSGSLGLSSLCTFSVHFSFTLKRADWSWEQNMSAFVCKLTYLKFRMFIEKMYSELLVIHVSWENSALHLKWMDVYTEINMDYYILWNKDTGLESIKGHPRPWCLQKLPGWHTKYTQGQK